MSQRRNRLKIAEILASPQVETETVIMGWVRTKRESKAGLVSTSVAAGGTGSG